MLTMVFDNDEDNDCHPNVSLADWNGYQRLAPYPLEKVVNRSDISMPDWYLPLARGVAFPSSTLLRMAGYRPGSHRARGWLRAKDEVFRDLGRECLIVQSCKPFWRIGFDPGTLSRPHNHSNFALVHYFGSTPIVTRTYQEATYLADFCFKKCPSTSGLCWVHECPGDINRAIYFAHERCINEIRAARSLLASLSVWTPNALLTRMN
jgi:hypothetical protein